MGTDRRGALVLVLGILTALPATAQETLPLRATAKGPAQRIYRGVFTPDSRIFLSAGIDRAIRAWDPSDGKALFDLPGHNASVHAIGLSGANLLVSAAEDGSVYLWDLASRKKVGELPRHKTAVHCLAVSHNGKLLATGGGDWHKTTPGEVHVWDLERREEISSLVGHRRLVLAVAFSPDDRLLAAVDYSGDVRVWDLVTRKPAVTLFQPDPVGAVDFSGDGKYLVTGDYRGRIALWDTTDWLDEAVVPAHRGAILFLRAESKGNLLASAGWDGAVKLWNLALLDEQRPAVVDSHKDKAWLATFSPDSTTLASVGEDGLVKFRNIPAEFRKHFLPPVQVQPPATAVTRTGPARVAVMALGAGDAAHGVRDLALAQLADEKGVVLLERSAVDRLLREQKLALAGVVSADTAVQAGKVLAVDLLAVLETTPDQKQALGYTVFDTATGVRLFDAGFTLPDAALQAREAAAGVRAAVRKWRAGIGHLKTVCFLPVRNADLPRGMDAYCEALAVLLRRQLLHHPAVVTLERQRLDAVSREKGLAAEAAMRELLGSVLVVEMEVGRASGGAGVRATLTVRDSGGKLLHRVRQQVAEASGAGLLEPLARSLHEVLHAEGPALVQRGREARRFLREAEILWKHGQYRPALQAAEAAYALKPDEEARLLLAQYLGQYALESIRPGRLAAMRYTHVAFDVDPETMRQALDLAERGRQLVDAAKPAAPGTPDHGGFWSLAENHAAFYAEAGFAQELRYVRVQPANPTVAEEVAAFRSAALRRHLDRIRELAGRVPTSTPGIDRLTEAVAVRYVTQLEAIAPDSTQLAAAVRDVLTIWLDRSRQLPGDAFPTANLPLFAQFILSATCTPGYREMKYTTADLEVIAPTLQALQEHPHPVVRLYAAGFQTKQLLQLGRISPAEAEGRRRLAEAEARRLIERPPFQPPDRHRVALYLFLNQLLDDMAAGKNTASFEEGFALADYMLERGDVVAPTWLHVVGMASGRREYHARILYLIRRMREVYEAPRHRLFHDPYIGSLKRQLANIEWNVLKMSPQLDTERPALPWDRVVRLVELAGVLNANALMAPTRHERDVYLFAGGTDPVTKRPFLQLVRAPLDGSGPVLLGKAFVTLRNFDPKKPEHAFWEQPRFVSQCVIYQGYAYVGTVDDGVYAFPLAGGAPVHIGEKEGLPSLAVVSVAAVDGKLVAALEEGYLAVLDVGTNHCEVIASSRRTQTASPFDNMPPFRARDVLGDPERHRILFVLMQDQFRHPNTGTWEYNLQTRRFRKLTPLFLYRPSRIEDGKFYLKGHDWLGRFDLAADRFTLLQGKSPEAIEPQAPAGLPGDIFAAFPDTLYLGNYLWQASPFGRQPIAGGKVEFLPHVTLRTAFNVVVGECLEAVSSRELLVGDWRGVYLVHLKDQEKAPAPRPEVKKAKAPEVGPLPLRATGHGHANRVYRGVFSPDGKTFFSGGGDRAIRAWDVANGKERFTLTGHASPIQGLGLVSEHLLVSGGEDGTIYLWDPARREKVGELPRHQHGIHCLAVSADGKLLATGGGGGWNSPQPGELRLWDLQKRELIAELPGERRTVLGLAFSPDGKRLAAVDQSGDLKVWDVGTRKAVTLFLEQAAGSVQFSPDGKLLAVGSYSGRLRLYETATLIEEAMVRAHRMSLLSLCYAPAGSMLATASYDGKVGLWNPWDLEDQPPLLFPAHKGQAWLVVFAPEGRTLASAGEDGKVKFWDVPAELMKRFRPPPEAPRVDQKPPVGRGPPKVAVVTASDAEAARGLQELALAQLGGEEGLQLLDRANVERLFAEQKLSLSGLVDASTVVRAGKILAVDLLAIVGHSGVTKENTAVIIFDAATGLKLVDAGFSAADLELQARQVAAAVRTAAARWQAGPGNLKTVCFVAVRNADLPPGMERFVQTLAAMLERELLGSGVALLERKRLDLVNKEKGLAEDAATRRLLASLTLVEMDVGHARQGEGIRATITLRDNAGRELHRITQEVADPNGAGLLAPLAQKVGEALKTAPANARENRNRESRHFQHEAQILWKHKYYLQALRAAEAAFALKQSDDARLLLTEYLLAYATELVHPGGIRTLAYGTADYPVAADTLREALTDARRALQLIDAARASLPDRNDTWEIYQRVEPFAVTDAQRFFFNKLPYLRITPAGSEAQADYEEFRLFCVRRIVARCYEAADGAARDPKALDRYTSAMVAAVENITRAAPSGIEYSKAMHDLAVKWLELARGYTPSEISLASASAFGGFLDRIYQQNLIPTKPAGAQAEEALDALARAVKNQHPVVRLYATHYQLRLQAKVGKLSREAAIGRHQDMLAEGRYLIDNPPPGVPADKFRITMYHLLNNAIGTLYLHKSGAAVIREDFELCDFMLARNDVVEEVINSAVGYGSPQPELNLKALQIIDRALQVTDSPTRRLFADSPERFKFQVKEARRKVAAKLPDAARAGIPWDLARQQTSSSELGATVLLPGLVHDGQFYFFAGGEDPKTKNRLLTLVRMSAEGGPVKKLGSTLVSVDNPPPPSRYHAFWYGPWPYITSTAVAGDRIYAGTMTDGILVFPLAGGNPTRIGEKEGLPARQVHRLAVVDETLVASLEGGYIVACDLAGGTCRTVASSRRGEMLSPFDNSSPFTLAALAADPERHRVLFTLSLPAANDPRGGLWEFEVKARRFRKVQAHVSGTWSEVSKGRIYLYQSDVLRSRPDVLLAYELAEDRFTLLNGQAPAEYGALKSAEAPADLSVLFPGKGLLHRCYFWQVYPFGRHTLDEKKEDYFPSPRDNSFMYGFSAMVSLRPAGARELLVGDYSGLYLLRFKKD
jgi:WD40 repeat protein